MWEEIAEGCKIQVKRFGDRAKGQAWAAQAQEGALEEAIHVWRYRDKVHFPRGQLQ